MPGEEIVYLDNNATTQLDPAVVKEMLPFLTDRYGNPSSGYQFGGQARRAIDRACERVAALLGCESGEIVFTSCGTESNNAAINSALQLEPRGKHIVTSAVEHSAVLRHAQSLARRGCKLTSLGVDQDGKVDLRAFRSKKSPLFAGRKASSFTPTPSRQSANSRFDCAILGSTFSCFQRTNFTDQKVLAHFT